MCLAVVALGAHPRLAVVLAANRDEFRARPATSAHWWRTPRMLAGRDDLGGGTWLGVTPTGRFAFVTNVREPGQHDPDAPTRGVLVPQVLGDCASVPDAVARAVHDGAAMNGFNLIAGDRRHLAFGSNRVDTVRTLPAGVYGVSNAALDTPWPKLVLTRNAVAGWLRDGRDDPAALLAILADRRPASDAELPRTGVPLDWERLLSAPFIDAPQYGTRCSTVLLLGYDGCARFIERRFDATGATAGEVDESFALETAA